jgi:hypothetical protein
VFGSQKLHSFLVWKDLSDFQRMNLVNSVGNSMTRGQFDGVELSFSSCTSNRWNNSSGSNCGSNWESSISMSSKMGESSITVCSSKGKSSMGESSIGKSTIRISSQRSDGSSNLYWFGSLQDFGVSGSGSVCLGGREVFFIAGLLER